MIGIYCIINCVNGKRYIGSSSDIDKRKLLHLRSLRKGNHHNTVLQRAFNKYGEDSFKFEILEVLQNEDEIVFQENYWIAIYDTLKFGYNMLWAHTSSSEGLRKRISWALKGKMSNETKEKMRKSHLGKTHSQETKDKIGRGNEGKIYSQEVRNKIGNSNRGKTRSKAHRAAISKWGKDRWNRVKAEELRLIQDLNWEKIKEKQNEL